MSLAPIPWHPDRKLLVQFSEFGLFFLGMVAAPPTYFRGRPTLAATFWVAAVLLRIVGVVSPKHLRWVFLGLTLVTWPIGWVVSHVVLAVIYYAVVTPVAILLRLLGRDLLSRRSDAKLESYWEPYRHDRGLEQYLRPY
ncbi:SxtJ family membrane protein [Singulisphaera rosea]